jgi:hypothetical protein
MSFNYVNDNNVEYYQSNSDVFTWQGICPIDYTNEYLICGTQNGALGAVYKGSIDLVAQRPIDSVVFPNSTGTSVYGPDFTFDINCPYSDSIITLVGSYQTGEVGIKFPCKGFGYKGKYSDLTNPDNYFEIVPDQIFKYTVVHSNRGGLAVYISSDTSQANLIEGKSFVYDIDKKQTISSVIYPGAVFTTTYGIWYNGQVGLFDQYTISGGFSTNNVLTETRTFIVDFTYNRITGQTFFENWTEINIPEISIYTHAQGISGLGDDLYVLPIANFFLDPSSSTLKELSGGKIIIKRVGNQFIKLSYQAINFPQTRLTIVTSAAENVVVGVSLNNNLKEFSFEAISLENHSDCC